MPPVWCKQLSCCCYITLSVCQITHYIFMYTGTPVCSGWSGKASCSVRVSVMKADALRESGIAKEELRSDALPLLAVPTLFSIVPSHVEGHQRKVEGTSKYFGRCFAPTFCAPPLSSCIRCHCFSISVAFPMSAFKPSTFYLSLSLRFNGHFSRWTWVSRFYWS